MRSARIIALSVSLLFHSVAGVTYWQWNIHHRTTHANLIGFQPTELALVLVTGEEEVVAPVAPSDVKPEIVKAETPPSPLPMPQSDPPPDSPRRIATETEIRPVIANDSPPVIPTPIISSPSAPVVQAVAVPEIAKADARPSAAAKPVEASARQKSDSFVNFAGYRRNPKPLYPPLAQARRWEGTVLLSVRISPDGTPAEVKVKESSGHPVLDEAATTMVQRKWEFEPARINQTAITSTVEVPICFHLTAARTR